MAGLLTLGGIGKGKATTIQGEKNQNRRERGKRRNCKKSHPERRVLLPENDEIEIRGGG